MSFEAEKEVRFVIAATLSFADQQSGDFKATIERMVAKLGVNKAAAKALNLQLASYWEAHVMRARWDRLQ